MRSASDAATTPGLWCRRGPRGPRGERDGSRRRPAGAAPPPPRRPGPVVPRPPVDACRHERRDVDVVATRRGRAPCKS